MTKETAIRLIEDNLPSIYGYAYSRLYDKAKAEDLTSEIVLEILSSAEKLRSDEVFWGFAWRIAENIFRRFLRREKLASRAVSLDSGNMAQTLVSYDSFEDTDSDGSIYLLRRELSLLSRRHREILISYYVENKSCSLIAKEQGVSVETVKQHLFKLRKSLKEGMKMERKLGEKSYNPGTLKLDFWGNNYNYYHNICDKKLPQAILLAAYNRPLTQEELSVELGVAMPYLEEELETLETAGLLLKNGKRYETNIIILTSEYKKELANSTKHIYKESARSVYTYVKDKLPEIRKLDFKGADYDDNRLLFGIINIALVKGWEFSNYISPHNSFKKLPLGGNGMVFAHDSDYEYSHFKGVSIRSYNIEGTAWFSAENYICTLPAQYYEHSRFAEKSAAMCDAILEKEPNPDNETLPWLIENKFIISKDGRLSANFPVFENEVFEALLYIIKPVYEKVADCMIEASANAAKLLAERVPARLRPQCEDIAKVNHRLEVTAFVMESLIEEGALTLPTEKTPLCIFGVRC